MKKHCYVLLTNTDTSFSRMLRAVTGYSFTHSSFSLEDPTQLLYSFARLHKDFPLPAGFVRETPGHGTMGRFPNAPCALYEIEADEASWLKARRLIQEMERQAPLYKYNICGLPLIRMGIPLNRPYHMVCSQFVAYVLEASRILSLPKPYALFTPMDFTALAGLKLIFRGKLGDLSSTPAVFPQWNPLSDLSESFPALGMK